MHVDDGRVRLTVSDQQARDVDAQPPYREYGYCITPLEILEAHLRLQRYAHSKYYNLAHGCYDHTRDSLIPCNSCEYPRGQNIAHFWYGLDSTRRNLLLIDAVRCVTWFLTLLRLRWCSKWRKGYEYIFLELFILPEQFDEPACEGFHFFFRELENDHISHDHQHLVQNGQSLRLQQLLPPGEIP